MTQWLTELADLLRTHAGLPVYRSGWPQLPVIPAPTPAPGGLMLSCGLRGRLHTVAQPLPHTYIKIIPGKMKASKKSSVVECLPGMHETQGSVSRIMQKKKEFENEAERKHSEIRSAY